MSSDHENTIDELKRMMRFCDGFERIERRNKEGIDEKKIEEIDAIRSEIRVIQVYHKKLPDSDRVEIEESMLELRNRIRALKFGPKLIVNGNS